MHIRTPVRSWLFLGLLLGLLVGADTAQAGWPGLNTGKIVFTTTRDGNYEVYSMNPDGTVPNRLTTTTTATEFQTRWSSDGAKVAFRSDRDGNMEIYSMLADGSNQTRLTNTAANEVSPAWSPDGNRIVFVSQRDGNWEIYVMNADGTGQARLTNLAADDLQPQWSPDGSKIAFMSGRDGDYEIFVMNPDGSGQTQLTFNTSHDYTPDWSPDGSKLTFTGTSFGGNDVFSMNANGTGQTRLTPDSSADEAADWSPEGNKIVFQTTRYGGGYEIATMNADGSGVTRLTTNGVPDETPSWAPVAIPYARPKGGIPFYTSLVLAYKACAAPTHAHAPPLAFGSCNPAVPASPNLTVGSPDANLKTANFIGSLNIRLTPGNPNTAVDEADLPYEVSLTDIREQAGLADYAGELRMTQTLRITDRNNYPGLTATAQDTSFAVTVPCAATVSTTIGSTCALVTTADAQLPGMVKENQRSIWELGATQVYDGGPDGDVDTLDNDLFAVQGVFAP